MLRRSVSALILLGLLLAARPMLAADPALEAISSDASVVIRLKAPKATIDKVAGFVDQVMPGKGNEVRAQSALLGLPISNPTLAGVDMGADWWVAVYATGVNEEPGVVFVIPGTDVKAMKEALGSGVKFSESGKLGVYTENEAAAAKVAARIKGQGKSIATVIEKDSTTVFDKGDLSVFVNVAQLVTVYKDHLTVAKQEANNLLENLPEQTPGTPGFNPKAMQGLLTKLLTAVFQGVQDSNSLTVSMAISKESIAFEDLLRVKSSSETDKFLQKSAPAPMAALTTLPAASMGFFGLHGDLSDVMKFSSSMMAAFTGENADVAKEMEAVIDGISKLKFGTIASSFSLGSLDQGAIRGVTVTEVSEPNKMRELYQRMFKAMSKVQTGAIKQTYDYKPDAEKFGRSSADVVTVKTEGADANDPTFEMIDRLMKSIYGPEGMTTRSVYLRDRAIQTVGGGKDAMAAALAAQEQSSVAASSNKVVQQARGRLSDKANVVVLFDLPGTVAKAITLVAESGLLPIPLDPAVMKGVDIKPSYLGFSLATEPQGVRVKTSIPVEQAQGVAKLVQVFMALQGG